MTTLIRGFEYSFRTKAATKLEPLVRNAVLLAQLNFDLAVQLEANIAYRYREIFPYLPAGTPNAMRDITYYYFQSQTGSKTIFADQWIDFSTIEQVSAKSLTLSFPSLTQPEIDDLLKLISASGISQFTSTIS